MTDKKDEKLIENNDQPDSQSEHSTNASSDDAKVTDSDQAVNKSLTSPGSGEGLAREELAIEDKVGYLISGKDGKDGKDGNDGRDGKDGKDGRDGENGKDGADGKDGIDGKDGKDGADGNPPPPKGPSGRGSNDGSNEQQVMKIIVRDTPLLHYFSLLVSVVLAVALLFHLWDEDYKIIKDLKTIEQIEKLNADIVSARISAHLEELNHRAAIEKQTNAQEIERMNLELKQLALEKKRLETKLVNLSKKAQIELAQEFTCNPECPKEDTCPEPEKECEQ